MCTKKDVVKALIECQNNPNFCDACAFNGDNCVESMHMEAVELIELLEERIAIMEEGNTVIHTSNGI